MRLLVDAHRPGATVLVVGGEGLVQRGGEGRVRRDAAAPRTPGRGRAGVRARGRLDAAGRSGVRAEGAGRRGRHPLDRHQHRLDDPAGARDRAGKRHARLRRAHRRSAGSRPSPASPRCRSSKRPSHGSGRGIRSSSATDSTPTSSVRTAPASRPRSCSPGSTGPSTCSRLRRGRSRRTSSAICASSTSRTPRCACRTARATVRGATRARSTVLTCASSSAGDRPVDLLRAGAAAIWSTGRAIFGFRVPEELYADPFHRP